MERLRRCTYLLEHLGKESQISADVLAKAEAFVCKLYNPGTQEVEINKERAAAFRKSKKDLDALPRAPTQDALIKIYTWRLLVSIQHSSLKSQLYFFV